MTVTVEKVEEQAGIDAGKSSVLPAPSKIEQPGTYPLADYSAWRGLSFPVYCISVDSYLDVYLQLNGDETNRVLDLTSEYVQSLPENGPSEPFSKSVGTPCLAYFDVDQFWYRARIVADHGDGIYDVYFVDYGNTMKLSEKSIMACPSSLISYVEGITKVALNGFTGDETEQEVKILQDLMESKNFMAKIDCVKFEIKGKQRMLLSLFDFETGVPLKTQIEQALKAQRDSDRTPLEKQASTEDLSVKIESPSPKGDDDGFEPEITTVACDEILTAQEACPLEELEEQESNNTNISPMPVSDDTGEKTKEDDSAKEPNAHRSLQSLLSSLAASAVHEFTPSFNATDSSEQNASPLIVSAEVAVVHAHCQMEEPEVAATQPIAAMTEDVFDGHMADYLRTAPVIRIPSAVSPSPRKTNDSPDEQNNEFVDVQLPLTELELDAKQKQVDSLTMQLKIISDQLSELKKEKERWTIEEKELAILRKQMETQNEEHERILEEMSAKLHETLVAKSRVLHTISKLQEELTVKAEKLDQVEVDMENMKIEGAKRAQRKQIEMGQVISEYRLKIEQLEKDKTAAYNHALLADDNIKQLQESHAVEVAQLQFQLQEREKNIKELETDNLKMGSEKAQMDKINMELRSNLEEKQAELSQQCHDELEELRKENAELQRQNRQLVIIKENLERQLEEKAVAFEHHTRERHGSGSASELLSPRSVPGAGSFDFEARLLMQKGVIRRLTETLDAVVKLYTEETQTTPSRPKSKTLRASTDPCQLAHSFQID